MSDDWKAKFRELYQSAQERYRAGRTTTLPLFEPDEVCFLATIGCSTQELFDFVEQCFYTNEEVLRTIENSILRLPQRYQEVIAREGRTAGR